MNTLCQTEIGTHGKNASGLREKQVQSNGRIHFLSVGSLDRSFEFHDALLAPCCHLKLAQHCFELWMIPDFKELRIIPRQEAIQLAILHNTLSSFELDEVARLIRRQWPSAGILLLSTELDILDHALYDDRIAPDTSPGSLFAAIDHLLQIRRE